MDNLAENSNSYDWVPFYEELANKILLYKDDQFELISKLKSINNVDINRFIINDYKISPFAIFESFNRNGLKNNPERRSEILSALKDHFEISNKLPSNLPENLLGQKSDYFIKLQSHEGLIETTWNLLQSICFNNEENVIKYYDEFLNYNDAGFISLTIGMYWLFPTKYIPCVVEIRNKMFRDFNVEIPAGNLRGKEYLYILRTKGLFNIPEFVKTAVNEYNFFISSNMNLINKIISELTQALDKTRYTSKRFNEYDCYVWIGTVDRIIGNDTCHYEFHFEKNKLYVDVHFEDGLYQKFQNVGLSKGLRHIPWGCDAIRVNPDAGIDVNDKQIVSKALALLDELESKIGNELRSILVNINNKSIGKNDKFSEIVELLKAKKNIILQGAPGTGKTYNTASLALSVIGEDVSDLSHAAIMQRYEELLKEGQIQFTTFHQSMDYEDFVEGIKPKIIEDEATGMKMVSYETENGIFKRICNRAKKFDEDGNTNNNFEVSWQKFVDKLEKENYVNVPYLSDETKTFRVELNEYGTGLANRTYKDDVYEKGEWITGKSKFFSKDQLFNIHQGKKGTPAGGHDNYRRAIIAYMRDEKNEIGLDQEYKPPVIASNVKPHVLIIDEINRGNVSKIFGELITLLEADKRELVGEDAKNQDLVNGQHTITVTLPYSKEPFTVPSNLYIIGTMNTTDRSTGTLDYALRRRFAFATISSTPVYKKDDQGMNTTEIIGCEELNSYYSDKPNAPKNKANELFVKVYNFLSNPKYKVDMDIEDLMVGHSYFMAKTDDELASKLEYEVKPLIHEYAKDGIISISETDLKNELKKWN